MKTKQTILNQGGLLSGGLRCMRRAVCLGAVVSVVFGGDARGELIGWWKLDGNLTNSVTNAFNGALYPSSPVPVDYSYMSGMSGQAFSMNFGASNNCAISMGDHARLDFGSQNFTVSYWVNKRSKSVGWSNAYGIAKWYSGAPAYNGQNEWTVGLTAGGNDDKISFQIESGSTKYAVDATASISTGVFHHVAAVRASGVMKLYVDGVLVGTNATLGSASVNNVGRVLYIGDSEYSPHNYRPNAIFDDVQIYNEALPDGGVSVGQAARGGIKFLYNNPGFQYQLRGTVVMIL